MKSIDTKPLANVGGGTQIDLVLDWEEAGVENDKPRTRLISRDWISVNGLPLHLMAIEVKEEEDNGIQVAVDDAFSEDVERLQAIDNTAFQTTEIEGRTYIIYATPHGA